MRLSRHSLHPILHELPAHRFDTSSMVRAIAEALRRRMPKVPSQVVADSAVIPLTTVSLASNFDAYINILFRGQTTGGFTSLLVDSGNSLLIVPSWEDLQHLPAYTAIGDGTEPWGSPAKIVRGPIDVPTKSGAVHTLEDCVFYACTGAPRTANFGAGCLRPWSANSWATPPGVSVTMQAPLSYNAQYPFAEFNYAPASALLAMQNSPRVAQDSELVIYRAQPAGYSMCDILPNVEWMALVPKSLTIGDTLTQWPGTVDSPIAMVDTGGGPVFLSDPNGYIYPRTWPEATSCPSWTSTSDSCQCVQGEITVELASPDSATSLRYTIRAASLPPPAQGLTLVMCKNNAYMMGQQGMNIGGLSALFNAILIDYGQAKVGLKPK
ncbi:MAG TPA: hypothetical protein VKU02_29010 [Gemmataceae bacterium]|nr:hypothetical protein [Gemmataceae bacterium]